MSEELDDYVVTATVAISIKAKSYEDAIEQVDCIEYGFWADAKSRLIGQPELPCEAVDWQVDILENES